MEQQSFCGKIRRNARISVSVLHAKTQKRKKLIFFVNEKAYSIGKAASRLKIKLSTAKMIVKRYNTHGTFFHPKNTQKHAQKSNERGQMEKEEGVWESGEVKVKMQQVKIEQKEQEIAVKIEQGEREQPTLGSSFDAAVLPSFASWNVLMGDYPFYFNGYAIHPFKLMLHPLFLA